MKDFDFDLSEGLTYEGFDFFEGFEWSELLAFFSDLFTSGGYGTWA